MSVCYPLLCLYVLCHHNELQNFLLSSIIIRLEHRTTFMYVLPVDLPGIESAPW